MKTHEKIQAATSILWIVAVFYIIKSNRLSIKVSEKELAKQEV